jgi:hypothetical protein
MNKYITRDLGSSFRYIPKSILHNCLRKCRIPIEYLTPYQIEHANQLGPTAEYFSGGSTRYIFEVVDRNNHNCYKANSSSAIKVYEFLKQNKIQSRIYCVIVDRARIEPSEDPNFWLKEDPKLGLYELIYKNKLSDERLASIFEIYQPKSKLSWFGF